MLRSTAAVTHNPSGLFSKAYRRRQFEEPVLVMGSTSFTRQELIDQLENHHVVAAARLTVISRKLGVTSTRQILAVPMTDCARIQGIGEASLRIIIDLLLWNATSAKEIDAWVKDALKGNELVQWTTVARWSLSRGRRRAQPV